MSTDELLTEQDAAIHVDLAPGTLREWRYLGQGPPFIRLSRSRIRYRKHDLDAWLEAQRVVPKATES